MLSPEVLERFREPVCAGALDAPDAVGEAGSPDAGTWTCIEFRLAEDGEIAEARFQCFGCPSAVAAASWLCERIEGSRPDEALAIRGLDVADALNLAPEKLGVALVAEDALKAALAMSLRNTEFKR